MSVSEKKPHNPKSHSPAVYIPCWLIQVPIKLISNNAKMLYGRLCQWSTNAGDVYRSIPQLMEEVGTTQRTLERHLKELKDVGLIETYQTHPGGINHYAFYHHPWMDEPVKAELTYSSTPPPNVSAPPDKSGGTPPTNVAHINKKEIKRNKKELKTLVHSANAPVRVSSSFLTSFEDFWAAYPVKKSKKKCMETWKRRNLHLKQVQIMAGLTRQIAEDEKWREGFIPHPSTFLNGDRWEDEPSKVKGALKAAQEKELKERAEEQIRLSKMNRDYEIQKHQNNITDAAIGARLKKEVQSGTSRAPKDLLSYVDRIKKGFRS